MNVLNTIIAAKRREVAERKIEAPLAVLEKTIGYSRERHSFRKFLLDEKRTGIIAEFKRKSPSKGIINNRSGVTEITRAYTTHGASVLSVLTDSDFFGGSTEDVLAARVNEIPILRKDFIIDEYQLYEARSMGADAILLIAACLQPQALTALAKKAGELGLEVLLELHDEDEIRYVNEFTPVVGINNRNLKTFTVDTQKSISMAEKLPKGVVRVAESGIHSVEVVQEFRKNGFQGFLIGELFMKAADPGAAFRDFVTALNREPA